MTNSPSCGQSTALGPASALDDQAAPGAPSLRDLFVVHAPYVWNTLRRLGIPASDLEDLTHDVFLQIHRHFARYDWTRPVRPWLFGFAYRIASQHRRRTFRRREAFFEPELAVHGGALPDELAAAGEERRLVVAALQAIDLKRRAVFVLHELDGVEMSEIARALEIPANTAYSRLRAARAEFAAAIKRLQSRRGPP
jgi:RNA polymerase sigma-70 factor (ECF subfamily)